MPVNDSMQSESTDKGEQEDLRQAESPATQEASVEEIVTPIEAGVQAQAEHEFETERKIPATCKTAIVSVNGEDIDEVALVNHERAA